MNIFYTIILITIPVLACAMEMEMGRSYPYFVSVPDPFKRCFDGDFLQDVSDDGKTFLLTNKNNELCLLKDEKKRGILQKVAGLIYQAALSGDGQFVSVAQRSSLDVYRVSDGFKKVISYEHSANVDDCMMFNKGILWGTCSNGFIKYTFEDQRRPAENVLYSQNPYKKIDFLLDNVVVSCYKTPPKILYKDSGSIKTPLPVNFDIVRCIACNNIRKFIACAGDGGVVDIWNMSDVDKPNKHELKHEFLISSLAFNADGSRLAAGTDINGKSLYIWDINNKTMLEKYEYCDGIEKIFWRSNNIFIKGANGINAQLLFDK